MAQTHLGPVTFCPPIRREDAAPTMTTMPTTTTGIGPRPATEHPKLAVVPDSVYLPTQPQQPRIQRFLAGCVAVAGRACRLAHRYRLELAPAGAVSTLTALGWAQYMAGAGGWMVAGYTTLGALSAGVAGLGLHLKHERVLAAGTGLTVAFADVATAVAGGPGSMSLTATLISSGLAYGAYVPWLMNHRKHHKPLPTTDKMAVAAVNSTVAMGSMAPTIEDATAAATNTANTQHGAGVVPALSPFWDDVIPYADETSRDIADPIRIGWDENGQPVYLTLLYRHTLVAGASDWGKSGLVNLIIKKILRKDHVELYGIDMKPGAVELGPWEPLMRRLARGPEEARDLLQAIRTECDRRGALLEDLSKRSMASGGKPVRKWVPSIHGPAWFVVTDELAELIRQDEELRKEEAAAAKGDPDAGPAEQPVATTYQSLLALARGFGIQFISATQQPSAKVFGGDTDARGNYTNRLCTRVAEAGHTQFIFGTGWKAAGFTPNQLTRPGEFYLGAPEMPLTEPPKCRAEYVNDMDIAADVAHLHAAPAAQPLGRFAPQGHARMHLVKEPVPAKPVGPPAPVYPDGSTVPRAEWPDLYRVFCELCDEQGHATKEELTERGPFESRDTVRRALDVWLAHGVQVRKAGRAEQFFLPSDDSDD